MISQNTQYFNPKKQGESISGKFLGITINPFPAFIIDDGALWMVPLSYQIREFIKNSQLPAGKGVNVTITFDEEISTNSGQKMNIYTIEVDEETLPPDYDVEKLTPKKYLDPSVMTTDQWEKIEKIQNKEMEADDFDF